MLSMMMALLFTALIVLVVAFQLALALGAPWGEFAMGGKYPGKYPIKMRITAFVQALVLLFFAMVVLTRSGLLLDTLRGPSKIAIWFVVGFMVISLIMNLLSRSKWERRIWAPVASLLFVNSLMVALL